MSRSPAADPVGSRSETAQRFLVTGAMGCIGAWVVRLLLDEGTTVVAFDRSNDDARLRLITNSDALQRLTRVNGDITEPGVVDAIVREQGITHVVHCAAMQVPFVNADPPRGASVNVVGTVNVFEAVVANRGQVRGFAYASSAAVFGPPDAYPDGVVRDDSPQQPDGTLYGVFKHANEHTARHYAREHGVASVGLRPFVVYGPGRDQGMTSTPTLAILAAVVGVPYSVSFGGSVLFNFAGDAAAAFVNASRLPGDGARMFNIPGTPAAITELIAAVDLVVPGAADVLTHSDEGLPAPSMVDDRNTDLLLGDAGVTCLVDGVAQTVEVFRAGLRSGLLEPPPSATAVAP